MKPSPMDDERYCTVVEDLIHRCEEFRDDRHADRLKAIQYYEGSMPDLPTEKGRSAAVSRDLRAAINKVRPSIARTILGGERIVQFTPVEDEDEAIAEQVTDFFNDVLLPECGASEFVDDVTHDALLLRNGIAHWYMDERREPSVSMHTGLDDAQMTVLVNDDAVQVLEHTERPEMSDMGEMLVHDVKIMRVKQKRSPVIAAVPLEEFLIHPDAISVESAKACGRHRSLTRSELIAMGYDAGKINAIPSRQANDDNSQLEDERRDSVDDNDNPLDRASDEIDYYEMWVRVDKDGDGLAELRRCCFAGGTKLDNLLDDDYTDEAPFADIVIERKPHTWEGVSISDDAMEIQRIKTALLRETLNNLYWQNKAQPIVDATAIENPEDLLNPAFGRPIRLKPGRSVDEAITFRPVPFVAKESFAMLSYWDEALAERTGVNDASAGLAPDALQNMTAKGSALLEQGGIARTELMIRNIAVGLRRAFKGLYRLMIQHADKPRMVRLKGEPVMIDPRQWNADMDLTLDVGMGAGSRERDLMAMTAVEQTQFAIATRGPHLGIVTPDNIYRTAVAKAAAAGVKAASTYFTKPEPGASLLPPGPSAEQQKLQAEMMLEEKKMQAQREKEIAQGQADVEVAQQKHALEAGAKSAELDVKREELASRERIELAKLAQERELALMQMGAQAKKEEDGESDRNKSDVQSEMLLESMELLRQAIAAPKAGRRFMINRDPATGDMTDIAEAYEGEAIQ